MFLYNGDFLPKTQHHQNITDTTLKCGRKRRFWTYLNEGCRLVPFSGPSEVGMGPDFSGAGGGPPYIPVGPVIPCVKKVSVTYQSRVEDARPYGSNGDKSPLYKIIKISVT